MKVPAKPQSSIVDGISKTRNDRTSSLLRDVLAVLTDTELPLSAYEILRRVSHPDHRRLSPPSIYRVLERLIGDGMVGRLESRNAFIRIRTNDPSRLVYCICDQCGAAQAIENASSCHLIDHAAEALGFQIRHRVLELQGICAHCSTCRPASAKPPRRSKPSHTPK